MCVGVTDNSMKLFELESLFVFGSFENFHIIFLGPGKWSGQ